MIKFKTRLTAVVTVFLLAFAALPATPGHASWNACPDGDMCFWSNQNYWGTTAFYWPVRTVCYPVADWASSIRNRTGTTVRIFTGGQCSGAYADIYNGQSFSPPPSPVGDNQIESFRAG